MASQRVEVSPAEQLRELCAARDRYMALAESLKKSAEGHETEAIRDQEAHARRIAKSYASSIASFLAHQSVEGAKRDTGPPALSSSLLVGRAASVALAVTVIVGAIGLWISWLHYPQKTMASRYRRSPPTFVHGPVIAPASPLDKVPALDETTSPAVPQPSLPKARDRDNVAEQKSSRLARYRVRPNKPVAKIKIAHHASSVTASDVRSKPPKSDPPPPTEDLPRRTSTVQRIPGVAEAQATDGTRPLPSQPVLLNPIKETHTTPRYPPFPARFGQSGTTHMKLSISSFGAVTDCEVIGSSGSEILDRVACRHVLETWKWRPSTQDGKHQRRAA